LALNRLVVAVIQFALFPFVIGHVGKEVYGVYLLVLTMTGYMGLLDLGVMSALTKYVSEFRGRGDFKGLNDIVNASFTFYVLVGVVIGAALLVLSGFAPRLFRIQPQDLDTARQLFLIAGCSAVLIWPLSTFRGTVMGFNLWSVDAVTNIAVQILNAAVTVFIVHNGGGIIQIFLANQILLIAGSLALYVYSQRNFNIRLIFPYADWPTFKFIFDFSFFMFLGSVIYIFLFQIHNIAIGAMISMSAVSVYAVAFNVQNYLRSINSILGAPPWTVASEMEGRQDYAGQKQLLFKGTKYMSAAFLPVTIITIIFAEPFVRFWMGPEFIESVLPMRVIIIFWLFNGTIQLASGMLSAKGIVRAPLVIQLAMAVLNLAIIFLFIRPLGILAPALGLTAAMVLIGFPFTLRLALRSLGVSAGEYFDRAVKGNLIFYLAVAGLAIIVLKLFNPQSLFYVLLEMGLIYAAAVVIYYCFMLEVAEKAEIKKLFAGINYRESAQPA